MGVVAALGASARRDAAVHAVPVVHMRRAYGFRVQRRAVLVVLPALEGKFRKTFPDV